MKTFASRISRYFLLVFITTAILPYAKGQQKILDSLQIAVQSTSGVEKLIALDKLCQHYFNQDPRSLISAAHELRKLALEYKNLKYQDLAVSYLGEAYFYLDAIDNSILYFKEFLEINIEQDDADGIASGHNNLGIVYRYIEEYDKAIEHYEKSLNIKEKLEDTLGISNTLNNLGVIYFKLGQYEKALVNYQYSLEIDRNINNKEGIATSLLNLGEVYSKLKDYQNALQYLKNSIDIAERIGDKHTLEENYRCLSEIYKDIGEHSKALFYYELYTQFRESRINKKTKEEIAQLELTFETERQEQEIAALTKQKKLRTIIIYFLFVAFAVFLILSILLFNLFQHKKKSNLLLQKQNQKIEEQHTKLDKLNKTKDKFFSIISHDLKGAIGGFLSQTEFLAEDYTRLNEREQKELLVQINISSKRLYNLLENLLQWSKSQIGSTSYNPEPISLKKFIESVVKLFEYKIEEKGLNIHIDIEELLEIQGDTNMLGSVFRNIIQNAIKFSYEKGNVSIVAKRKNEFAHIIIEDNGKGMDEYTMKNLFRIGQNISEPGINEDKGSGLGLILAHEFIHNHNGKIWVESETDKGTRVHVKIPLIP